MGQDINEQFIQYWADAGYLLRITQDRACAYAGSHVVAYRCDDGVWEYRVELTQYKWFSEKEMSSMIKLKAFW